jgi:hypothetical protein
MVGPVLTVALRACDHALASKACWATASRKTNCPEGDYDSKRLGDVFVHAVLRAGNVHTASGVVRFSREAVKRSSTLARSIDVRLDAVFTVATVSL